MKTSIKYNVNSFYKKLPKPINKNTIFCSYARNGLFKLAKKIKEIDTHKNNVLVPAYSCGDEIQSLLDAGLKIKVYNIKRSLQIDVNDLKSKIDRSICAILITHYFGFPQKEVNKIKDIADSYGIFLIEDCAHTLGGSFNNKLLGEYGHASVFSLRKMVKVPSGGAVLINDQRLNNLTFTKPSKQANDFDLLVFLGQKKNLFKPGTSIEEIYEKCGLKKKSHYGPRLEEFGGYDLGISSISKKYINQSNWSKDLKIRLSNFNSYLNMAKNINNQKFKPLFNKIEAGTIPLSFPVLVKDSKDFYQKLKIHKWTDSVPFWSYFHDQIDWDIYPISNKLKKQIISFPLNKKINFNLLKNLILLIIK